MKSLLENLRYWTCAGLCVGTLASLAAAPAPRVKVEVEEEVYSFTPSNNGSGPSWCSGSTCIVRVGDQVVASGVETLPDAQPLNNVRWVLFERGADGWRQRAADPIDRTREPSPLVTLGGQRVLLSANPTLATDRSTYAGPARPAILEFSARHWNRGWQTIWPVWEGTPKFTEHSYRSFAADRDSRSLIVFQNIDYTHAEWAFLDRHGTWSAHGKLPWPEGPAADKKHPIRVCYPDVTVRGRAVYFCGVSDIVEPNLAWRAYKKELTGREWDYDFRRLFFTWTPDITRQPFRPWMEVASRDATCGWISPGDMWVAADGAVHLVWMERALDERLRPKFFPEAKQTHALRYAVLREGRVEHRATILEAVEGGARATPSAGRFHVTPDRRLFVMCYVGGADSAGQPISENRLYEIGHNGSISEPAKIPLRVPFTSYFTATPRAGNALSHVLDVLGHRVNGSTNISYARLRVK